MQLQCVAYAVLCVSEYACMAVCIRVCGGVSIRTRRAWRYAFARVVHCVSECRYAFAHAQVSRDVAALLVAATTLDDVKRAVARHAGAVATIAGLALGADTDAALSAVGTIANVGEYLTGHARVRAFIDALPPLLTHAEGAVVREAMRGAANYASSYAAHAALAAGDALAAICTGTLVDDAEMQARACACAFPDARPMRRMHFRMRACTCAYAFAYARRMRRMRIRMRWHAVCRRAGAAEAVVQRGDARAARGRGSAAGARMPRYAFAYAPPIRLMHIRIRGARAAHASSLLCADVRGAARRRSSSCVGRVTQSCSDTRPWRSVTSSRTRRTARDSWTRGASSFSQI